MDSTLVKETPNQGSPSYMALSYNINPWQISLCNLKHPYFVLYTLHFRRTLRFGQGITFLQAIRVTKIYPWAFTFGNAFEGVALWGTHTPMLNYHLTWYLIPHDALLFMHYLLTSSSNLKQSGTVFAFATNERY